MKNLGYDISSEQPNSWILAQQNRILDFQWIVKGKLKEISGKLKQVIADQNDE